ncbi:hypothetical protein ANCDUO_13727, partial [Ancylostoma duodenale]
MRCWSGGNFCRLAKGTSVCGGPVMLSVYVTVLAAFDCFVSVLRGVSSCNTRSTWAPRVLAGVVVTVAAYNVIQFADLE